VEDSADQAEKAVASRNLKQLYDIAKTLAGKRTKMETLWRLASK
jgi:hypothetical protein